MPGEDLPSARRRSSLLLTCLTLFLLLLTLTLSSPGLPAVSEADAAAYYLASLSLWHDRDLVCDDHDARRLFRDYPGTENLLLMARGRGETVYFGVPIPYPLAATPWVALVGANGMALLNAALLVAMVWMGAAYLRHHNRESLATLFAAGFFVLSTAWVYVFWPQAEVFNMACVMAAFYLIERAGEGPGSSTPRRHELHAAGAAALLATAGYSKPMLAALALPMVYLTVKARGWRGLAAFVAAGLLTVLALVAAAGALTEEPWPYFGHRMSFHLASPVDYLERQVSPRFLEDPPARASRQITRIGEKARITMAAIVRDAAPEFLFGRHGGFLFYMPFAVLSIFLFLLNDRRSAFRWLILASAALTAVLLVTLVRGNWLGGGGFVGNRLFTAVYPSFLFLVRRIHPPWLTAVGYGAAAVFLGPLLIAPASAPTLQAHVRHQPFPHLPLEWSLARRLPGYQRIPQSGLVVHGRRDEIMARRDEIWVWGARRVEIHLLSADPQQSFVFDVRNLAPDNRIELCLQNDCRRLIFGEVPAAGDSERVTFAAQRGDRVPRAVSSAEAFRYRLTVASDWGEQPRWRGSGRERFYLGAALAYLGSPDDLARHLYDVAWLRVDAPASMIAGATAAVAIAVRNQSRHRWPSRGATRVRIAYHWLRENGDLVLWEGRRTELSADVAAGAEVETQVRVEAPEIAGRYVLAIDLVRERVSWFSAADREQAYRAAVEIVAPAAGLQAPDRQ